MDAARKAQLFNEVLKKFATGQKIDPGEFHEFVDAQNEGATSGISIGARIPDFSLPDQSGKTRSFDDLTGKSGLLLVFTRSADW